MGDGLCQQPTKRPPAAWPAIRAIRRNRLAPRAAAAYSAIHRAAPLPERRNEPKESTMYAASRIVRLVSAVLAVSLGAMLVSAKVHFSDVTARLAAGGDVIVLPLAEVIGERPAASLAAAPGEHRAN